MSAPAVAPRTPAATRAKVRLGPSAVDALFVLVLTGLGLVGFHPVYGGSEYLVVGLVGAVLGIGVTELAGRLRQPVLAEAVVALLVFLLLGGATTARGLIAGLVPSPSSISALGHVGVYGWKELLTTAPPVGTSSNLMAIPYIVGLIAGVGGQSLARRTRLVAIPLLGPGLVLALGILFGARRPDSLLLQGSMFGLLALAWAVVRYHRTRVDISGARFGRDRLLMSVAVLAVAGLVAGWLGPDLPGAGSHPRVVLSKYVAPPFQASRQASPLAGFRQYVKEGPLYSKVLFIVKGVRPGTEIRIATMDGYNGVAWGFGAGIAPGSSSGDVFRRYGSTIQSTAAGVTERVQVTIGHLGGIWLPEVGELRRISFAGPSASRLAGSFLYDTATETAAAPVGLAPGVSYTITTSVAVPVTAAKVLDGAAAGDVAVPVENTPSILQSDANQWSSGASGAYAKVMAIAGHLRSTGYFSDGLENPTLSLPGHSEGRLILFLQGGGLDGSEMVGDGEQYAATLALMANAVGVPARVVLGAAVGPGGVVTGADVEPWVEVDLAGLGWQPIYASQFMDPQRIAHQTPPKPAPNRPSAAPVQPPVASALHAPLQASLPGADSGSLSHFSHPLSKHSALLPGWLADSLLGVGVTLAALALGAGLIVGTKARRRRRRRRAASPAAQIAGAWHELMDVCRDLGMAVPSGCTRREQAAAVGAVDLGGLARRGDASVFGPGDPSGSEVDDYWTAAEQAGARMRSGLGRRARWRAALSLRSFRPAGGLA